MALLYTPPFLIVINFIVSSGDTVVRECCSLSAENPGAPRGVFLCKRERSEPLFRGERPVVEGRGWPIIQRPGPSWAVTHIVMHGE